MTLKFWPSTINSGLRRKIISGLTALTASDMVMTIITFLDLDFHHPLAPSTFMLDFVYTMQSSVNFYDNHFLSIYFLRAQNILNSC